MHEKTIFRTARPWTPGRGRPAGWCAAGAGSSTGAAAASGGAAASCVAARARANAAGAPLTLAAINEVGAAAVGGKTFAVMSETSVPDAVAESNSTQQALALGRDAPGSAVPLVGSVGDALAPAIAGNGEAADVARLPVTELGHCYAGAVTGAAGRHAEERGAPGTAAGFRWLGSECPHRAGPGSSRVPGRLREGMGAVEMAVHETGTQPLPADPSGPCGGDGG